MRHNRVEAVLVTEGDHQLRGIFTGRDAVHRVLAEVRSPDTTLAEIMTRDPDCIRPGKKAIEALRLMEDGRYRHLPIVEDGKVVGICFAFRIQRASNWIGSTRRPASGSGSEQNQLQL